MPALSTVRAVSNTTPVDEIVQVVREDGGVIIEDFISREELRRLNAEIDVHLPAITPGPQKAYEGVPGFHGAQTRRMTRMVERSLTFRERILDLDLLHALCDAAFIDGGTYWLTTAQVIEIGPGSLPQPLHRDIVNWPAFDGLGPSGPEVIVNYLIALDDNFTDEAGATRFIPGSHLWRDFSDRGSQEMTVPVEMKAGSAVFFGGKVVHGGGPNSTEDRYRRALTIPVQLGFLTPEEPFPFLVDIETVRRMPERVQRIIGFRSQYPKNGPGLWQVDSNELGAFLGIS